MVCTRIDAVKQCRPPSSIGALIVPAIRCRPLLYLAEAELPVDRHGLQGGVEAFAVIMRQGGADLGPEGVVKAKVPSLDSRRCGQISITVVKPSAVALPK